VRAVRLDERRVVRVGGAREKQRILARTEDEQRGNAIAQSLRIEWRGGQAGDRGEEPDGGSIPHGASIFWGGEAGDLAGTAQ
jgi:hypothetical protein